MGSSIFILKRVNTLHSDLQNRVNLFEVAGSFNFLSSSLYNYVIMVKAFLTMYQPNIASIDEFLVRIRDSIFMCQKNLLTIQAQIKFSGTALERLNPDYIGYAKQSLQNLTDNDALSNISSEHKKRIENEFNDIIRQMENVISEYMNLFRR
jgi:hypothetical protein